MAFPSVPNTFSSGSVISSSQVNTNFSSLVSGLSDGTKDFSMNNGTLAGTLTVPTISCTTTVKIADGSASVPSLALSSDADGTGTGLYRKAANSLGFVANGTECGFFSSAGSWTFLGADVSLHPSKAGTSFIDIENTSSNAAAGINVFAYVPSTSTTGDVIYSALIDGGISWTWGLDNSDSDALVFSRSGTLGTNNVARVDPTVRSFQIRGTNTNDNATTGWVGEETRDSDLSTSISTSATWQNISTISITAGDWDISAGAQFNLNGATCTLVGLAISINSGNTTTDQVIGDNQLSQLPPTASASSSITISQYRISTASTITVYCKASATFSAGNPQVSTRISARRRR